MVDIFMRESSSFCAGGIAHPRKWHAAAQPSGLGAADSRSTARSDARTALTARTACDSEITGQSPSPNPPHMDQRAAPGAADLRARDPPNFFCLHDKKRE